jgi:hypothetical protein
LAKVDVNGGAIALAGAPPEFRPQTKWFSFNC